MNPIQSRFSSVQELRRSNVDVPALKANGQLEVDGKRYEIRAADDGTISVLRPEQQSKAKSFFKGASQLIGGSSQRAQIAQALNEKVVSARTVLHQGAVTGGRLDTQAAQPQQPSNPLPNRLRKVLLTAFMSGPNRQRRCETRLGWIFTRSINKMHLTHTP